MDSKSNLGDKQGSKPSLFGLNDGKAGMQGLDKERINQIIQEASKDSPFYNHVMKRDKKIDEQVESMLKKWATVTEGEKRNALEIMARNRIEYERQARDLSQIVVHVDMDMFFAAVEMRDNPSLRDKPIAVGSFNMIATSNYAARRYGVRAAMAGFIGQKLCPELILIKGDHSKYRRESEKIMNVLRKYDPDISIVSCDEAYLNLTPYVVKSFLSLPQSKDKKIEEYCEWSGEKTLLPEVWDHAFEVVQKMRDEVYQTTQLTASAGISTNTMLSKICSDLNKPNGQYMMPGKSFEFIQEFVKKIDVRKIPGIGPVSEKILKAFNIQTVEDLWNKRDLIYCLHDNRPSTVDFYLRVSLGLGNNMAVREDDEPRKSKGTEASFKATRDFGWLCDTLKEMAKEVSESLDRSCMKGKTITVRLKKDSFQAFVRSKTITHHTSDPNQIFIVARSILKSELELDKSSKYRLIGVRVSNLVETILDPQKDKQMTLERFLQKRNISDRKSPEKSSKRHKSDHSLEEMHEKVKSGGFQNDYSAEFICPYCRSSINDFNNLDDHLMCCSKENLTAEETCQSLECPVCGINSFENLNSLNAHLDECLSKDGETT